MSDVPRDIDPCQVRAALNAVKIPEFVAASNKKIVTDENVSKTEAAAAAAAEMDEEEGEDGEGERLLALMEGAKCRVRKEG